MPGSRVTKRVALISSSFAPHVGGVEEHVRQVARELTALGHAVEVWTVDRGEHLGQRSVDGVNVRYLPTPLPARSAKAVAAYAAQAPGSWRRWAHAHRTFRPEVLHVQCFGPNGLYALGLHHRYGTPLVVSSHGETFGDDHSIFEESAVLRAGLTHAVSRASRVTGCSAMVLDHLRANFGLDDVGLVVPNGVDLTVSGRAPRSTDEPYLFAVGRLGHPKGFDLLIDAYAESSLPSQGIRLVIGGDGPELNSLMAQRHSSGLDVMVDFAGRLSPSEVADRMDSARAVVVPSRIEAFGIVALEAWRSEAPLVMSNRGGGQSLVSHGIDGLLVDPTDTPALAQAIEQICRDRGLADRLVKAGRDRVHGFTWAATAAAYDQVYAELHR